MKTTTLGLFLIISVFHHFANGQFPNFYPRIKQLGIEEDAGDPLILTTYIKKNKIEEARRAAEVNFDDFKGVKSYSGYFTVNETKNSNLFFWFFPSESDYANDPVVLWLEGGPGVSSVYSLFDEIGPFIVSKAGISLREYSWSKSHSVIYIDNPVGTGFSYTNGGFATEETQIGEELYSALQQFFTVFHELQQNEFYIAGQSYAGKYIPALGHTIHKKNRKACLKINLQGLAIGNGWSDPEHQINFGDFLYQIGLIDSNTRDICHSHEQQAVKFIQNGQYVEATAMLERILGSGKNDILGIAGFTNTFNYLYTNETAVSSYDRYVQKKAVRAALHVGNSSFNGGEDVFENLKDDFMKSVAPWVSELLSHYRVLLYNGQLDISVAYPVTLNYLQNLKFAAAGEYKTAPRYKWYVDSELAGYVKQAGNLIELLVRNSGHVVPQDQPKWASDLIYRFTRRKSFADK